MLDGVGDKKDGSGLVNDHEEEIGVVEGGFVDPAQGGGGVVALVEEDFMVGEWWVILDLHLDADVDGQAFKGVERDSEHQLWW